jgi:uncharacterized protein with HEPN domain
VPPRDWKLRVQDILDAIAAIQEHTAGMDFASFAADRKTVDAVVYNFAVIGEASRCIPEAVADTTPHIPWKDMREMRNVLVHVYFGVNKQIVWDTIHIDLPPLVPLLKNLL